MTPAGSLLERSEPVSIGTNRLRLNKTDENLVRLDPGSNPRIGLLQESKYNRIMDSRYILNNEDYEMVAEKEKKKGNPARY